MSQQDEVAGYHCDCDMDFTGRYCQVHVPFDIDECSPNPCLNEGECQVSEVTMLYTYTHVYFTLNPRMQDGINSFTCTCAPQWTGDVCDIFCTVRYQTTPL